jgi:hypothetical protein
MPLSSFTVALLAFSLFGVDGNGKIKEEAREIQDFHAISVGAGIQAKVSLGEKPSVRVEADENLLPLIRTEIKDGTLVVDVKESISPSKPVKLTVVDTKISAASVSGGARIETPASPGAFAASASGGAHLAVEGLSSDEVAVEASGGADVKLTGKGKRLAASSSGGAKVEASDLAVESAVVSVSGGARIFAAVSGDVTGKASGGATLHLKGKPNKSVVSTSGGAHVVTE